MRDTESHYLCGQQHQYEKKKKMYIYINMKIFFLKLIIMCHVSCVTIHLSRAQSFSRFDPLLVYEANETFPLAVQNPSREFELSRLDRLGPLPVVIIFSIIHFNVSIHLNPTFELRDIQIYYYGNHILQFYFIIYSLHQ